jgi:glycosyltransferase involved in cell wall biosynthesis
MHERVLTAMASGCGVISDHVPVLAETFEEGALWLHAAPGASLHELLAGFDADRLERMSAAAAQAVAGRFGMPQHVDSLLAGVEALGGR